MSLTGKEQSKRLQISPIYSTTWEDNLEVELLAIGSGVQMVKKDAGHEEAGMIVSAGITSRRLSTLRVVEVLREV